MRVIFAGSGEFGLPTLEALQQAHEIVGVITQPDRPAGRKRKPRATPIGAWADERGLPTFKADNVNEPDFIAAIAALQPDASVVIAFGQKLSPQIIDAMGKLTVNLHASLLPKYRGAAPINWAIMRGERETGVSVIALAQRMDAGDVYGQIATPIDPNETAGELHDRLATLGPAAVLGVLDQLATDTLSPQPQTHAKATKAPKLSREDGRLLFDRPAAEVVRQIHGLTPWPGCRAIWRRADGSEVAPLLIRRAAVVDATHHKSPGTLLDNPLHVAAGDGVFEMLEIQPAGGRVMAARDFANGRDLRVGDQLTTPAE